MDTRQDNGHIYPDNVPIDPYFGQWTFLSAPRTMDKLTWTTLDNGHITWTWTEDILSGHGQMTIGFKNVKLSYK
jgi:hypothetical protein